MALDTVAAQLAADTIYNRMSVAAGEVGMFVENEARQNRFDTAEAYGLQAEVRRLKRERCRDIGGAVGDTIFNQDDFWEMAADWICDEVSKVDPDARKWGSIEYKMAYAAVCDALAERASFKRELILSWRHDV